uniref:epithelial-stromal interaction protein 1 n=1 Tax=Panthera onca TaxID=9690 RepID=UPI00295498A0|nr:epithelial-stromal interaction protein 1 [Panthera onca]
MFTRTRVVGSGLGAPPAPRPAREPPGRPREPGQLQGPRPGSQATAQSPSQESPRLAGQRCTGAYTLITPNENRRNQIQRIAEKELENLEKWKEQQRAKPVTLVPRRLGGSQSEAEVRQKQQLQLMQSKYQQKLKREESVRIKKQVEEARIQQMKAVQRQKSNKLEEKKRLQENLRREAFREHQQYMSGIGSGNPCFSKAPLVILGSTIESELLEFNRQQQEEERTKTHQAEHKRVNNAFLDRLQGKSQPGGFEHFGGHWNMNSGNSWDV